MDLRERRAVHRLGGICLVGGVRSTPAGGVHGNLEELRD
jgi:hypothetical protein